ncbi:DUF1211 domain-containing protein [candidate division KSB1 bacterium]|nr:DUF1211 domain-containing protein [candidate division KSB1 bacterium]
MDAKKLEHVPIIDGFRMRGMEMTRMETFTDAAFAFATTLLVISVGTIPTSYEELILALKGVPAFAASFASITYLWIAHRRWSRRYGLEDGQSTLISLSLIFTMLVYVYPLKIIFSALFSWISGGWLPSSFRVEYAQDFLNIFIIYGIGYATLTIMIALLNQHALKLKDVLHLNKRECLRTRYEIISFRAQAATGLLSALIAWLAPVSIAVFAGFAYSTLPITMPIIAARFAKMEKTLQ